MIRQLLPDRLTDCVRHYEKPRSRKNISYENYHIEDYLQDLQITRSFNREIVVDTDAAIPHFRQQLAILNGVKNRFEGSLFDIRPLVQADVFDSGPEAATSLAKNKLARAAGALAAVVLEKHLAEVYSNHGINLTKRNPGIADYNDALRDGGVLDVVQWRFIQHLGDIRNLCAHNKGVEPTKGQVDDLIAGATKITKTVLWLNVQLPQFS